MAVRPYTTFTSCQSPGRDGEYHSKVIVAWGRVWNGVKLYISSPPLATPRRGVLLCRGAPQPWADAGRRWRHRTISRHCRANGGRPSSSWVSLLISAMNPQPALYCDARFSILAILLGSSKGVIREAYSICLARSFLVVRASVRRPVNARMVGCDTQIHPRTSWMWSFFSLKLIASSCNLLLFRTRCRTIVTNARCSTIVFVEGGAVDSPDQVHPHEQ